MDNAQKQAILQRLHDLKDLHIFSKMNEAMIFEVMKHCEVQYYSSGASVFQEGDTDDYSLYIVVKGEFEVLVTPREGGEAMPFSCAGRGLIFGEVSFLDAQPRSASLKAVEDAEVLRFTHKDYMKILSHEPETAARFMIGIAEILSRRLRGVNRRLKFVS